MNNSGHYNNGIFNMGFFNTGNNLLKCFNKPVQNNWEPKLPDWLKLDPNDCINLATADLKKYITENIDKIKDPQKLLQSYFDSIPNYSNEEFIQKQVLYKFEKITKQDVLETLALPNFDYEIFEKITGISKEMIEAKLADSKWQEGVKN